MTDSTLWIDVTDLLSWTGNLTGIQRVHFELCKEFSEKDTVKFFSMTPERIFIEEHLPQSSWNSPNEFSQSTRKEFRSPQKSTLFWGSKTKTHKTKNSVLFSQADTVLIIGASWSTPDLPETICSLKDSVGFTLIFKIYDLIPVYAPHFFGPGFGQIYTNFLVRTISSSDVLLSISQHTTSDVQRFISDLNIPEVPIITFRLGDNPVDVIADTSPSAEIIPGEFVLVVGTVEVRKNHQALYLAWELAAKEDIELPPLVIVGRPGWNVNDLLYDINTNPLVKNNITIISDVNDDTLGWLYRNCLLTVYPSWYEGWGLPVAESLHFGKLCISSNASSMPEIGGDLVEYCSPYEPRAFMEKIAHYYSSPKALAAAEKKIAQKYAGTSWKESFHHIWDGLQEHTS